MSIFADLANVRFAVQRLQESATAQHAAFSSVVHDLVAWRQTARLAGDFSTADRIRGVLAEAGIEIVQGTAGYAYEDIPAGLQGRQVNDTWKMKSS